MFPAVQRRIRRRESGAGGSLLREKIGLCIVRNVEKGEIELTITEAMGEEKSEKVLLEYQVEDGKLSLEVQEDESGIMEPWQEMGFFDKKLSGK